MARRMSPKDYQVLERMRMSMREEEGFPSSVARYLAQYRPEVPLDLPSDLRLPEDQAANAVSAQRGSQYLAHGQTMERNDQMAQINSELAREKLDHQKEYYRFQKSLSGGRAARARSTARVASTQLQKLAIMITQGGAGGPNEAAERKNYSNMYVQLWSDNPKARAGNLHPDQLLWGTQTAADRTAAARFETGKAITAKDLRKQYRDERKVHLQGGYKIREKQAQFGQKSDGTPAQMKAMEALMTPGAAGSGDNLMPPPAFKGQVITVKTKGKKDTRRGVWDPSSGRLVWVRVP